MAIRARDLRKVYRLYRKPHYRILDMFGLLPGQNGRYTEHAALDGVSLDIGRGEKVAVIGRNGAGKSTFLKLVTNVIMPTSGSLEVTGKVHALLQIGTGFHPDFTGRENVYAYLAQLGVTGAEAARRCAEIVEFAELESYIDQPVKTYSTGMGVRLMFSTSTAVTPDLLVLDEVLGVGDAYFAHKSYERIRQLCDREGTTLLLVTHDIYSAVNICSRIIWIDRGTVLMDGDGAEVVKAYEDSIRQQEESRLRVKQLERMREAAAEQPGRARSMLVEIKPPAGRPAPSPVHFARIAIETGGGEAAALPLGADGFDPSLSSRLQDEGTAWGEPGEWQGRGGRPLKNYGSAFHKAAGVLAFDPQSVPDARLVVDYWSEVAPDLMVEVFHDGRSAVLGRLDGAESAWNRAELPLAGAAWTAGEAGLGINVTGITGSGALRVRAVRPVDAHGHTTFSLRHGEPAGIEIDYELVDPAFRERPHIVVAWQRDGVTDVCRFISRDVRLDAAERTSGTIRLRIPRLLLVDGSYAVTILIAKEGYYDRTQTLFYTLNPDVYYVASRLFEVLVRGSGLIGAGTVVVGSGEWDAV
jgi:ABC-type polysaccharide/polyol phosphate transport system ATPase subunit